MSSESADTDSADTDSADTDSAESANLDAPSEGRARPPSVQFRCAHCDHVQVTKAETLRVVPETRRCEDCGVAFSLGVETDETAPVDSCWICGNREFFIQRDFNRQLGFFIVAATALVVMLVMLLFGHRVGIFVLLGVALLDLVVYHLVPDVTVCYLCNTLYRGFPRNEAHSGFYLGLEEKHKKLRKKWAEDLESSVPRDTSDGTA